MTFTRALAVVLALVLPSYAWGAISLSIAPSYDAVRYTTYPNGDKPVAACTAITTDGFTETAVGDGGGEGCKAGTGEYDFSAFGSNNATDAYIAYKDAGSGDVQVECRITDTFAGSTEAFAAAGCGIRGSALQSAYIAQCHSLQSGSTALQIRYGSNSSYTTVNGASGQARPRYCAVTYDLSSDDIKFFESDDGSAWVEIASTNQDIPDPQAYLVVASKSATETTQVTIDNWVMSSTIDAYTPSDPPAGTPPVLTSSIPNQTGTQGSAFSLTFSSYFTGATSYTASGFPGSSGLSETSDGVVSGTPASADVSGSPYNVTLCGVNADGSTCDVSSFSFSSSSGSTHVSADVADNVKTTINCNTFDGGVEPGDTIEFTSGSRGPVELQNCHGNASNYIKLRKSASATRLTFNGSGSSDIFLCRNCSYVDYDFTVNWTGHTGGCGVDSTLSETPLTDCGLLVTTASNQAFGVKLRGEARFINIKGIEVDGNWDHGVNGNGIEVAISPHDQNYCVATGSEFRESLTVQHNYLHDLAHEIMYFGMNVNYGSCGSGQDVPRLRNIDLGYNFMQYGGWDGGNLKSAYSGTNNIHHNVVLDIGGGTTASGANSVGWSCFESECNIYHNKIRRTNDPPGGAAGISCSANQAPSSWGTLDCQIYGNDISDTDGNCITISRGANADANRSATVYNNTLTDCGGTGITVSSSVTGGVTIRDNIAAGENINLPSGNGNSQTNNNTTAEASVGFTNAAGNDYTLTAGSSARNAGTNGCPSDDLLGTARPQGAACDQGAYEYDE